MYRTDGRALVDSLQLFMLSVAVLGAALTFLLATVAGVSVETAVLRALIALAVLCGLAVGAAMVARWVLRPRRRA
jgi:hypothetical protein